MKTLKILKRMFDNAKPEIKFFILTVSVVLVVYLPILNSLPPHYGDRIPDFSDIVANCLVIFFVSFLISIIVVAVIIGTKYLLTSFFESFNYHKEEFEKENSDEYKINECKDFLRRHGVDDFK